MKKKSIIMGLFILLIVPSKIYAISGSASCSGPSTVELGETFTVTISGNSSSPAYWQSSFVNSSGNLRSNSGTGEVFIESASSSFSNSYSFTAISTGSASVSQYFSIGGEDGSEGSVTSSSCNINIVEATKPNDSGGSSYSGGNDDDNTEVDPDKSSNNYLKSLTIDGVKFSPAFNKDKLEYTAVVAGDKEKINISGTAEDDKASVDGLGEKELKEGINKFEITVTAENGQTKKYIISVTRKEKNPIEVVINKKKYTVAKKEIGLKVPNGFTKTSIVIEKQDVVAYSNSYTGYLLVALVDEEGNSGWYIYNQKNGTYIKYSEFKSNGLRLVILEPNKKDVPYKYKKCKVDINGEIVDGYALQLGSEYRLVYALNMDTGDKAFYLYDMHENTFQRFYNVQVDLYRTLLKKLEIGIIALGAIIAIMFIIIISQFFVNKKTKKFIKNGGKVEKNEPIIEDEEDEDDKKEELKRKIKDKSDEIKKEKELSKTKTVKMNPVKEETSKIDKVSDKTSKTQKIEEPLTREELRRRKKEEKREMEEARREFFDL